MEYEFLKRFIEMESKIEDLESRLEELENSDYSDEDDNIDDGISSDEESNEGSLSTSL
jgi:hypothetical protein